MIKNTKNSYGLVAKILHWIISICIISLIAVGFTMSYMDPSPEKFELYSMHKASGILVLSLVTIRVLWRLTNTVVQSTEGAPPILQLSAKTGHLLLYVFMLMMPISGLLMSYFGGYPISVFELFIIPSASEKTIELAKIFHTIHEYAAWGFVTLIIVHILAALYHHFIRKDTTLIRMI